MMSKTLLGLGLLLATTLLGAACTGGEADPTSTLSVPTVTSRAPLPTSTDTSGTQGTLEIRVTDKPNPSITAINLTVENVQVHQSDTGEWRTVVVGPMTFDLMEVTGIEELLGSETLPAGEYTQIRLSITSVTIIEDGTEMEARVPSDTLKVVRPFTITAGQTTIATLDFDAEQSVVRQGSGGYLLRPVVTLLVRQEGEPFEPSEQSGETTLTPTPTIPSTSMPTSTEVFTPAPTPTVAPTPTATPDATGDFFLAIEQPVEIESIVTEGSITVVGRTRIDATVSVNDIFADVDGDGRFRVTVELEEGPNIIEVVASLASGEELDEVLVVIYSP